MINIVLITLAIMLATKVLVEASKSESAIRLAEFLNIPIIPLLVMFALVLATSIVQVLA